MSKKIYTCDHAFCGASAEAGSEELLKEWSKAGFEITAGRGDWVLLYFCGRHSADAQAYDRPETWRGYL